MTTHSTIAEERLAELGNHLPDPPTPFGAYVPTVQTGNLLFPSGMLATSGHTATVVGVVGKDLDVKAGREAACTAALNVLALTKKQSGSLNRVSHVVRLGVYVAATPEFTEHLPVRPANRGRLATPKTRREEMVSSPKTSRSNSDAASATFGLGANLPG